MEKPMFKNRNEASDALREAIMTGNFTYAEEICAKYFKLERDADWELFKNGVGNATNI